MDEIVRSSVAETRNGLLGARSSRLASVVRFHTMARTKENAAHPSRAFGASRVSASVGPSCARAVLSMSHSEANDAPFRVEVKPDRHWYFVGLEHGIPCSHGFVGEQIRLFFAPSFASRNANADEKLSLSHRAETTLRDAFGCRPLQGVAPPYRAPRAVFAWDNRVQAISSVAKGGIPIRWEHAPDHASALSRSVADP